MTSITKVAQAMQTVLTDVATSTARSTGFIGCASHRAIAFAARPLPDSQTVRDLGSWHFDCFAQDEQDGRLTKAATVIQRLARRLAASIAVGGQLHAMLAELQGKLARGCRQRKRKAKPSTYQLLLNPDLLA